jgi:hypothetical protein
MLTLLAESTRTARDQHGQGVVEEMLPEDDDEDDENDEEDRTGL